MHTCIDVDKLVHAYMHIHRHMLEIMEGGGLQATISGWYRFVHINH